MTSCMLRPLPAFVLTVAVGLANTAELAAQAPARFWSERPASSPEVSPLPSLHEVARAVMPAVVSINIEGAGSDMPIDPFEFFGPFGQELPPDLILGLGSGFLIEPSGLIITNAHVVETAKRIEVTITDPDGSERTLEAEVLGIAADYDVALLKTKTDAKAKVVAYLGDSDALRIGDWVLAFGSPFGLTSSVSAGIISAKDRRDIAPSGRAGLYDFLQTDASINPGNSGGPLVNLRGEVVGMNAAINAAGQGIGFAIPINMIKAMLPQLRERGKFARSWIGIKIQPLTPELAQSYGLTTTRGVLVSEVVPESPAAKAGLKPGDVILEFEDKPLLHASDLPLLASMAGVGTRAEMEIWRDKKTRTLHVRLAPYPDEESAALEPRGAKLDPFGFSATAVTPEIAEQLGLASIEGVLVVDVQSGGAAARAGITPGDVVVAVNGTSVKTAGELKRALGEVKPGEVIRVQLVRDGERRFAGLKRPK